MAAHQVPPYGSAGGGTALPQRNPDAGVIDGVIGTKVPGPHDGYPCRVRSVSGDSKGTWPVPGLE